MSKVMLRATNLTVAFGNTTILQNLDIVINHGETVALIGPSGSGKSVLLKALLGLVTMQSGNVEYEGEFFKDLNIDEITKIRRTWGVLFQNGALYSSLSVLQNIVMPMREFLDIHSEMATEVAMMKLKLVGLPPRTASLMPADLSGGMIKRVALARALVLEPKLVLLDEPTSGLDPIGAKKFDELIKSLSDYLGLSVLMTTHDIGSLTDVTDKIAVLGNRKISHMCTLKQLLMVKDPWLEEYFQGSRAASVWKNRPTSV